MDAKRFFPVLCALVAFLPACSKYGRLSDSEKVVGVRIGAGGSGSHLTAGTPQPGGVVIWGKSTTGIGMSVLLPTDSAYQNVNLPYGDWTFYASGWSGTNIFSGTTRCGQTSVHVDSDTAAVVVPIGLGGCGDPFFSPSGNVLPLRLITCNTLAFVTTGGDTCDATQDLGDFQSFQVVAMGYDPAPIGYGMPNSSRASTCVNVPSTYSTVTSPFLVPDGTQNGSPIFLKVLGFPSISCGGTPVEFNFPSGLRGGAVGANSRLYLGASSYTGSNALFIQHGPRAAPTVGTLTPSSGGWGGKTSVVISGSNFDSTATVTINGVDCPVSAHAVGSLTCTPARSATLGAKTVVAKNGADGQSANGTYTYIEDGFGNGSDSFDSNIGSNFTIGATFDPSAANTAGTRAFHSYKNIMGVDATGKVLTIRNFVAGEYVVGDEVLWHISAGTSNATCAPSGLAINQFSYARVTAVDTTAGLVTIDNPISTTVNNTALANTNRASGQSFCVMQLVRVPNFESISINTAGTISVNVPPFDINNGLGGIFVLKANGDLNLSGGGSLYFVANNAGHSGATSTLTQGNGDQGKGLSAVATSNGSGGGAGNGTAAGGGGASVGNGGSPPSTTGGLGKTCTVSGGCAILGGGGGASTGLGGNGGGIVMVYARRFMAGAAFTVNASATGAAGGSATSAGGGGGGGTAFVQSSVLTNITLNVAADGGAPGTGTNSGGGGGGGLYGVYSCSTAPKSGGTSTGAGGSGTYGGSAGAADNNTFSAGMGFCP